MTLTSFLLNLPIGPHWRKNCAIQLLSKSNACTVCLEHECNARRIHVPCSVVQGGKLDLLMFCKMLGCFSSNTQQMHRCAPAPPRDLDSIVVQIASNDKGMSKAEMLPITDRTHAWVQPLSFKHQSKGKETNRRQVIGWIQGWGSIRDLYPRTPIAPLQSNPVDLQMCCTWSGWPSHGKAQNELG